MTQCAPEQLVHDRPVDRQEGLTGCGVRENGCAWVVAGWKVGDGDFCKLCAILPRLECLLSMNKFLRTLRTTEPADTKVAYV